MCSFELIQLRIANCKLKSGKSEAFDKTNGNLISLSKNFSIVYFQF